MTVCRWVCIWPKDTLQWVSIAALTSCYKPMHFRASVCVCDLTVDSRQPWTKQTWARATVVLCPIGIVFARGQALTK